MKKATIILHSGDIDKVYSALIIGNGALAMGMDVSIFFTFWGLLRLKKNGLNKGALSRNNFFGLGKYFLMKKMKKVNTAKLEKLIKDYKELGGKIIACEMTMSIMGIKKEDMDNSIIDKFGAIGTYIEQAKDSQINLFI